MSDGFSSLDAEKYTKVVPKQLRLDKWWIVSVIYQVEMLDVHWFQLLKCENFLFFFVLYI